MISAERFLTAAAVFVAVMTAAICFCPHAGERKAAIVRILYDFPFDCLNHRHPPEKRATRGDGVGRKGEESVS